MISYTDGEFVAIFDEQGMYERDYGSHVESCVHLIGYGLKSAFKHDPAIRLIDGREGVEMITRIQSWTDAMCPRVEP